MDPFDCSVLYEDVHRFIYQHLTTKDLLKISEVSTSWYEMTKQKIVNKVRLKINLFSLTEKDVEVLDATDRIYKAVLIVLKKMELENLTLDNLEICYLLNFGYNKTIKKNHLQSKTFAFDSWLMNFNFNTIKDLVLEFEDDQLRSYDELVVFVAKQRNLKRLEIIGSENFMMKSSHLFSLTELEFFKGSLIKHFCYDEPLKNLTTLIEVEPVREDDLFSCFKNFPKLSKLELEGSLDDTNLEDYEDYYGYGESYQYPVNTTIRHLKMRDYDHFPSFREKVCTSDVISSLPALVTLDIGHLSIHFMVFIARNMLALKTLHFEEAEPGTMNRYEQMKIYEGDKINKNICLEFIEIQ